MQIKSTGTDCEIIMHCVIATFLLLIISSLVHDTFLIFHREISDEKGFVRIKDKTKSKSTNHDIDPLDNIDPDKDCVSIWKI